MMNSQNARDVEVLKENDFLGYELNKFRKMFEDREGSLVSGLIQKFQEEKNETLRKVKREKEKSNSNIISYFDKMT